MATALLLDLYVRDQNTDAADDIAVLPGDIDGSGNVTAFDLLYLKVYLVTGQNKINRSNSDINGDGSVNSGDLLALRNMIINM